MVKVSAVKHIKSFFSFSASGFIAVVILSVVRDDLGERLLLSLKAYTNARTYTGIFPVPLSDSSVCTSLILLRSS